MQASHSHLATRIYRKSTQPTSSFPALEPRLMCNRDAAASLPQCRTRCCVSHTAPTFLSFLSAPGNPLSDFPMPGPPAPEPQQLSFAPS